MIGVALTAHLLDAGVEVFALVRPGSPHAGRLAPRPGLKLVETDLSALAHVSLPAVPGAAFFHLGWVGSDGKSRGDASLQDRNVAWSLGAVRLAAKIQAGVFLFAGSQAEYGRVEGTITADTPPHPDTPYGRAKLEAESRCAAACREAGIRFGGLRIFSVYGPFDGENTLISYLIRSFQRAESPKLTPCGQTWNYLYALDAARAVALVATLGRDGAIYNLASDDTRPLRSYVEELRAIVNPEVTVDYGAVPYAENQVMNLRVDTTPLQRDTGFSPACPFEDAIKEMLR